MIDFKQAKLTEEELFNYLYVNDNNFNPTLSSRLDIKKYSLKLFKYSSQFCAFDKSRLIGLVACYFNDQLTKTGFISSVSVIKEYQRSGVMATLLKAVIEYGKINGFNRIMLEVRNENKTALRVYDKVGFRLISSGKIIIMELSLEDQNSI